MRVFPLAAALRFGGLAALAAIAGCAPRDAGPEVRGPASPAALAEPTSGASLPARTRELVWVQPRGTLRITLGERLCRKGSSSAACVRLSRADRVALDAYFGTQDFRERWRAFGACPARTGPNDAEVFAVTYSDGEQLGRPLDAPTGTPQTRRCDRATRDAIATVGDRLVRRYFR